MTLAAFHSCLFTISSLALLGCAVDTTAHSELEESLLGNVPGGVLKPGGYPGVAARMAIDLSGKQLALEDVPIDLVTPEMAQGIGPGSHLLITIPDEGTFGCTANFVWTGGGKRYLGAAGHCFLPPTRRATHGVDADYDAFGVVVKVCVEGCTNGGFSGFTITGTTVTLGGVAYARQTGVEGDVGNDFGIVTIPGALQSQIRTAMPVFGGPSNTADVQAGDIVCHYGNGVGVGEVFPSMGRAGLGLGSTSLYWEANTAAAPGDSGSALEVCAQDASGVRGLSAAGILTHLSVGTGLVVGTTVPRAIELAAGDANLSISLVHAP